ncbi:MFS transporter [Azospirillum sp. SYSU D00513]|uniref:MFS transporter n=1 Tax=Azospirillum sp. SYSU D00513 TaxID=2812561 RepID=UPI001A97C7EA|nr:MFS transporter [Azospirillum sp. SYSU D00513]
MPSSLGSTLLTVAALLFGYAMLQVGNALQGTLLSVRGGLEEFSPTLIGLVSTGFSIGLVAGSLRAGRLIANVGHTRTFAALASVASASALLHLMVVDPYWWILFRALTGFCFAGLLIAVESWLNAAASPDIRGRLISVYGMAGLGASAGGQLLLPVAEPSGYLLFCLISVIISLALVPVALSRVTVPGGEVPQASVDLSRLYRQSPFGLVAAVLCGISTGAYFGLGPLAAQQMGFDELGIALFMAVGTFGAFALTWPLGWASDRFDRRMLIIGLAVVTAFSLMAVPALEGRGMPPWVTFALMFLLGGLIVPTYSIVIAHVNDNVSAGEFVSASSGLLIVQGIGAALGPFLAGIAMSSLGVPGIAYVIAAAQVVMAVWGVYRMTRRASVPAERKEEFVPMPLVPVGTEFTTPAE